MSWNSDKPHECTLNCAECQIDLENLIRNNYIITNEDLDTLKRIREKYLKKTDRSHKIIDLNAYRSR